MCLRDTGAIQLDPQGAADCSRAADVEVGRCPQLPAMAALTCVRKNQVIVNSVNASLIVLAAMVG